MVFDYTHERTFTDLMENRFGKSRVPESPAFLTQRNHHDSYLIQQYFSWKCLYLLVIAFVARIFHGDSILQYSDFIFNVNNWLDQGQSFLIVNIVNKVNR